MTWQNPPTDPTMRNELKSLHTYEYAQYITNYGRYQRYWYVIMKYVGELFNIHSPQYRGYKMNVDEEGGEVEGNESFRFTDNQWKDVDTLKRMINEYVRNY